MRKFCTALAATILLALPAAAQAQGYPSVSAAQGYAIYPYPQHPVHYYCGKSTWWVCDTPYVKADCPYTRGAHSRDCIVNWGEDSIIAPTGFRYAYMHAWVRLEPDYSLSFHVDSCDYYC